LIPKKNVNTKISSFDRKEEVNSAIGIDSVMGVISQTLDSTQPQISAGWNMKRTLNRNEKAPTPTAVKMRRMQMMRKMSV